MCHDSKHIETNPIERYIHEVKDFVLSPLLVVRADGSMEHRTNVAARVVMEGGQATNSNSRRAQSPTTQALETQFRTMMNGIVSSVDVASGYLRESAGEVLQRLKCELGDTERELTGELQVKSSIVRAYCCIWQ